LIGLAVTIVRRKAAKHWRHLKRQQRLSCVDDGSSESFVETMLSLRSPQSDAESEVMNNELVADWLKDLDPVEQQLIQLRLEGYSTVEVARTLALDPDVLRVKLSRLRKRLRERGFADNLL
jgi:RNA polymerase sigma factor (sigma-70 family)